MTADGEKLAALLRKALDRVGEMPETPPMGMAIDEWTRETLLRVVPVLRLSRELVKELGRGVSFSPRPEPDARCPNGTHVVSSDGNPTCLRCGADTTGMQAVMDSPYGAPIRPSENAIKALCNTWGDFDVAWHTNPANAQWSIPVAALNAAYLADEGLASLQAENARLRKTYEPPSRIGMHKTETVLDFENEIAFLNEMDMKALQARLSTAEDAVKRLREALLPFVALIDKFPDLFDEASDFEHWHHFPLLTIDIKRARAALAATEPKE